MLPLFALLCSLTGTALAGSSIGELPSRVMPDAQARGSEAPSPDVQREKLHEITVEGEGIGDNRSAYVWVPEGKGPFPVVFAVHGGKRRDGRDMVPKLHAAQKRGVILVYPNGGVTGKGRGWVGPDKHDGTTADRDVRYFRALIHTLGKSYPIQRDRMYVTGMSGGGYMTNLLWCEMSDTFAGFGVVSRAMPKLMAETCDVAEPRPFVLMLGTADDGLVNEYQLSLDDTRAFIRTQLECPDQPVSRRTLPDKGDKLVVRHERFTCAGGVTFDDYEIEGGGHAWPGVGAPKADKTEDIDATDVILKAFGL